MCVAGRDSSWRDRNSSLCLSWCFCFSGRSAISEFSISSSSSPGWWRGHKGQIHAHQMRRNNGALGENGGNVNLFATVDRHRLRCTESGSRTWGWTLDEPEQWSPQGGGEFWANCTDGFQMNLLDFVDQKQGAWSEDTQHPVFKFFIFIKTVSDTILLFQIHLSNTVLIFYSDVLICYRQKGQ